MNSASSDDMSLSQASLQSPLLKKGLSAKSNFVWIASGNAIYSACSLLMVAVVAKLGAKGDLGMFSLGLALAQPAIFLSQLNLSNILAVDVKGDHPVRSFFELRLTMSILAMTLATFYAFIAIPDTTTRLVVLLTMASSLIDSLSEIAYGLFRLRARMNLISYSLVVRGVLSLAGVTLGLSLFHSIVFAVLFSAVASLLTTTLLDTPMLKSAVGADTPYEFWKWGIRVPSGPTFDLVKLAWPLGLVMMLSSLTLNVPRYFVDGNLGHDALGLFSALASFATIGRIVVLAIGQAATPKLATSYVNNDRNSFLKVAIKLFGLSIAVGSLGLVLVVFYGPQMLKIAFTKDYASHGDLFVAVIAASAIGYLGNTVGFILTAAKVFRPQLPQLCSVVLVTTILCFLLIPSMGVIGAAWAIGIASIWQILSGLGFLVRELGKKEYAV